MDSGNFILRNYQQDIVARVFEAWRSHRSVMVQMPTGTGKTHVLAAIVRNSLTPAPSPRERGVDTISGCNGGNDGNYDGNHVCNKETAEKHITPLSLGEGAGGRLYGERLVLIVAHRRELVEQIEDTIKKMYSEVLDSSFPKGSSLIKVMSIQWLARHWDDVEGTPSLIVIDEAHHAVAETYKEMWNRWPKARFLGLTATPCRMNRRGFTDLFDTLICSRSIAEFIEKDYLSAFDYVSIRQGSEEQRLIDSLEKRGADGDYQIKEMNNVLNRNTSIGRLYSSMEQFAAGKKGIVYAISIDHARRIAEYYSSRGVCAVPIDSKTPTAERKRLVEDFRAGRIKVLVNVDIFSEGFNCPDVEFVQMARPTLSLAKYLQQVGRGLRKVKGKEACVLIDNVGLYRVFGLPTVAWNWQAMFQGLMAGKGLSTVCMRNKTGMTAIHEEPATGLEDGMEVIMSHEQLLADIGMLKNTSPVQPDSGELKAWQDEDSGLWGLKRGRNRATEAQFITVFDIRYGMAAVRFKNKDCGIVNDTGETVWKKNGCLCVRFLKNGLLYVIEYNREYYVDIYNWHTYVRRPKVRKYGNVELLEIDNVYYSRTKKVYVNSRGVNRHFIHWRKFYLTIYDEKVPFPSYNKENLPPECYSGHACILDGDNDCYYWMYYCLADGSIIIMDNERRYYHAAEGHPKEYIGCYDSEEEWNRCRATIELLARQTEENWNVLETERIEKRRQRLALSNDAVPFKSGARWGLRVGNRITIPPIYRRIKSPVGKYCAVEKNYSQWGVVSLDGAVMVKPQYLFIEINMQGVVTGTKVTGSKELIKLP